jgi:hypothetical protein
MEELLKWVLGGPKNTLPGKIYFGIEEKIKKLLINKMYYAKFAL